jgi:hypothetical protein
LHLANVVGSRNEISRIARTGIGTPGVYNASGGSGRDFDWRECKSFSSTERDRRQPCRPKVTGEVRHLPCAGAIRIDFILPVSGSMP